MSVTRGPVRHQTYSYLPSREASLPIGWYQIILLGDRSTRVLTTCLLLLHSTAGQLGFEPSPASYRYATKNTIDYCGGQ